MRAGDGDGEGRKLEGDGGWRDGMCRREYQFNARSRESLGRRRSERSGTQRMAASDVGACSVEVA